MGNVFGSTQWILDTVATTITADKVRIRRMEWVPNAALDDLAITDTQGEEIWTVTNAIAGGRAGLETIYFGDPGQNFDGFKLPTIGGGELYVYLA